MLELLTSSFSFLMFCIIGYYVTMLKHNYMFFIRTSNFKINIFDFKITNISYFLFTIITYTFKSDNLSY